MAFVLVGNLSCRKDDLSLSSINSSYTLSEEESDDLTFLIQEEKLARDVYIYAYEKHNQIIFSNISGSEQTHMDKVAGLLVKYGIDNPVEGLALGEFENNTLQQMYYDLTAKVDQSLIDALFVGATIEDLDINDIKDLEARTAQSDILSVYAKLTCGSTNHIRAFVGQIESYGSTYEPQYISSDEFNEIINSEHQQCGGH
ncbi:MAG: DUF2202 domain-containing protein [Flavobacteriales bacterium]|nr:DUF2202 domain-containing protein [Flavobacteriales bacterium]